MRPADDSGRAPGRTVRVEQVMGTAVSVDGRDAHASDTELDRFFSLLRDVDQRFSTYRHDSEVSRLADGSLPEAEVSDELRSVLDLCEQVRVASGGAFDIVHQGPGGRLDPSGLVKGWAVDRAADLLLDAGWENFCVNAGGDVLAWGESAPGRPWRVGIRHPVQADKVAAVVGLRNLAIATSASYERGDHIRDPATGASPAELLSVSVIGPRLTLTDAYATAAFVKGRAGLAWVAGLPGYEAFAATADHQALWTDGCDALLLPRASSPGGAGPAELLGSAQSDAW